MNLLLDILWWWMPAPCGSIWSFPLLPVRASEQALYTDLVFYFLVAMTAFFTLLIAFFLIYSAVRYRAGSNASREDPLLSSTKVEMVWVGVPFVISLGLFAAAAQGYFHMHKPPPDTLDVYVVGKQWMWKLEQPNGHREINELHVPVGRAVKLIMTSQDVIHSFFIPAFRVKHDVIPGRYVTEWFTATRPGRYHIFCSQYCGTNHSMMIGTVVVMEPADYQAWIQQGNRPEALPGNAGIVSIGTSPFARFGCTNCHITGSEARAPRLEGLYGKPVKLSDGRTVVADEDYLRESILDPAAKIVEGYTPVMPTYKNQVSDEELAMLIEYIKSLKDETPQRHELGPRGTPGPAAGTAEGTVGLVPPGNDLGTLLPDTAKRRGAGAGPGTESEGSNTK